MDDKLQNIETKNKETIEIEREQYETFLTENAALKKELELLKSRNVDQDVITISSTTKPTDEQKEKQPKKGILI